MKRTKNPAKEAEYRKRAADLVAQMTLHEKVSQMLSWAPAIERLGIPAYNWWSEGIHGVGRAGTATVFPQAIGMAAAFDERRSIIGTASAYCRSSRKWWSSNRM